MPYKKSINNVALGNTNEFFNKIKGEITSLIKSSEVEFYELELFSVQSILLDESELPKKNYKYYGAVRGYWVNDNTKKTLPKGEEWVLPLDPHIKRYPVIGENVVCVNYLGRTYYTTILNHQNNPNNNIMTGLVNKGKVGEASPTISTSPMFNKPVLANAGDIIFQGRFNNSINIGSQDLVGSSIKLVAHGRENPTYDLEKDAASIYIQDGGNVKVKNPNSKMGSNIVTGKKIILDADYIVINAKIIMFALPLTSFPLKFLLIWFPFTIIRLDIALINVSIVLSVNDIAKIKMAITIREFFSLNIHRLVLGINPYELSL